MLIAALLAAAIHWPTVTEKKLDNGLTVVLVPLSNVPKVSHGTWCRSATAEEGKPTPLWKAPMRAWAFSRVMSRSVSVTPVS